MEIIAIIAALAAFDALAAAFGKDTRDGNDWVIHRPV